jgi:acyl carrier protein
VTDPIERIANHVRVIGNINEIGPDRDFYEAGFSSVGALTLLLELETEFELNIPDEEFIAARTVRALGMLIGRLKAGSL